jgi:hypothetical protein
MGLNEIKKELKKLDKNQLIDLVADLYKKNKNVKEYSDFYIKPDEPELYNKYRQRVLEAFYPKRGTTYKLKEGKEAISDFKKLKPSAKLLADLMLFYVETGVAFTNDFGDINESFYSSLEKTYISALQLMDKENILENFAERAAKVVTDTSGIGWGFHDNLSDVYSHFFDNLSGDTINR